MKKGASPEETEGSDKGGISVHKPNQIPQLA